MSLPSTQDAKAIQLLHKMLSAAQKAHSEGKQAALSKLIQEASRLSSKLNQNLNSAIDESFKSNFNARTPQINYKPVLGVVVE